MEALSQAIESMIWEGGTGAVEPTEVAKMLAATSLTEQEATTAVFTATDPLTQAFKTLADYIDASGKSSWKPSWDAVRLSVRACKLDRPQADGAGPAAACGLKMSEVLLKKGAVRFHPVLEVRPDSVAAEVGLARGDIVLEVNDQVVIGQSRAYVNALLAAAWVGRRLQIVVLPATVARVQLPSYTLDRKPSARGEAGVSNVAMGLFYVPAGPATTAAQSSPSKRGGSPRKSFKNMFGAPRPKLETAEEITAIQEFRAKILRRAMQMLTNSNTRFPAQEWFEVFRPALVAEHGLTLVTENDQFLNEMISSMSMGRPDARPVSTGPSPSPIERSYSADFFAHESKRQEALEAAESAWQQEKLELEDRVDETTNNEPCYAYVEESDEVRQETLSAAERAWAAEKQRRRALGPGQALVNTVTYMRDMGLEQSDDGVPTVLASRVAGQSLKGKSPTRSSQKQQQDERLEVQRKHAVDALRAAEEAWQAEKARMQAKTAQPGSASLHMKRTSGGRVAPRRRELDEDDRARHSGATVEPNRPWYGGDLGET